MPTLAIRDARKKNMRLGFSLIEVIIVVVIMAVLAIIALPNYTKAKESGLGKEAISTLKLIAAAEKIYKVEQGAYINCNCDSVSSCESSTNPVKGCNYLLKLDINPENWGYSAYFAGEAILASASRQGDGGYKDCYYTVDSNGDLITTGPACP